jgi:hypothetical protein
VCGLEVSLTESIRQPEGGRGSGCGSLDVYKVSKSRNPTRVAASIFIYIPPFLRTIAIIHSIISPLVILDLLGSM